MKQIMVASPINPKFINLPLIFDPLYAFHPLRCHQPPLLSKIDPLNFLQGGVFNGPPHLKLSGAVHI